MTKQRVEAFSDGVFAVAITLLVLNFQSDRDGSITIAEPSVSAVATPARLHSELRNCGCVLGSAPLLILFCGENRPLIPLAQ